jgi:hypothetical protein
LGLTEHHLNFEELEITHLGNYSLGTNYCRKTLLKWGIHKNIRFMTINLDKFSTDLDIEVGPIQ